MADLKTTYKDDVLNTSANEKRKYNMITNEDGTVSLVDATDYSQVGDSFGAADINATNEKVNELNTNLGNIPTKEKSIYSMVSSENKRTLSFSSDSDYVLDTGGLLFVFAASNSNWDIFKFYINDIKVFELNSSSRNDSVYDGSSMCFVVAKGDIIKYTASSYYSVQVIIYPYKQVII